MDIIYPKIRSHGDKNTAVTTDGVTVQREKALYFPEHGLVDCVQYELHFVYENPNKDKIGNWNPMCTCGSRAGIINMRELSTLITVVSNKMIVACQVHTESKKQLGVGKHADGSTE